MLERILLASALVVLAGGSTALAQQTDMQPAAVRPTAQDNRVVHAEPIPVGVDLLPYVGTSSGNDRQAPRNFSFNMVGGLSGGVRGVEIGGVLNADTGHVLGAQLAGVANIATGDLAGAQIGGVFNLASEARGAQVGGALNLALADVRGAQLGTVNVAAGRVSGVQIGVVNYAEDADFQLGLVNIQRNGRTFFEAWADTSGFFNVGIKHGGAHFHYIYFVGAHPVGGNETATTAGLGLGGHVDLGDRFYLDVDGLFSFISEGAPSPWSNVEDRNTMATLRLVAGFRLTHDFALTAGVSQNLFMSEVSDGSDYSLLPPERINDAADADYVTSFPGLVLGVSYRL